MKDTTKKHLSRISVADYITQQIALSGKAQKDIATELGYTKPNIITMFKQGKTKVPLNKITDFAKVLGVDPLHFLRVAMKEYSPETWEVIEHIVGAAMVSANEAKILRLVRDAVDGFDVAPVNDEDVRELQEIAFKWKLRDEGLAKAALGRKD